MSGLETELLSLADGAAREAGRVEIDTVKERTSATVYVAERITENAAELITDLITDLARHGKMVIIDKCPTLSLFWTN